MTDMKALLRKVSREQSAKFLGRRRSSSPQKNVRASTWPTAYHQPEKGVSSTPSKDIISTRVLIISDTHCAQLLQQDDAEALPFKEPLPEADVLIHCGMLCRKVIEI